MNLSDAQKIARVLKREMFSYCLQIEIAGSIRREKAEVKDIELCAVPKIIKENYVDTPTTLFDEPQNLVRKVNELFVWARNQKLIRWIKPGTSATLDWQVKPDGKYWRGLVAGFSDEPIKLDLFLASATNFGVIYTIRTGSAEFSAAMMATIKLKTPFQVKDGQLIFKDNQEIIECPTEESFFKNAGIEFVPVEKRSNNNPYGEIRLIEK